MRTVSDRFGDHPYAGEGQLGYRFQVSFAYRAPRISAGRRLALCANCLRGRLLGIDQQWLAVASCRETEALRTDVMTVRHPCRQFDLRVVLQYPQDELLERAPAVLGAPPGRVPGGVFTCNYYHFARLRDRVSAVGGADISWCALSSEAILFPIMRCRRISRHLRGWSRKLVFSCRYFSYSPNTAHSFLDPGKGCSFLLSWETAMGRYAGRAGWAGASGQRRTSGRAGVGFNFALTMQFTLAPAGFPADSVRTLASRACANTTVDPSASPLIAGALEERADRENVSSGGSALTADTEVAVSAAGPPPASAVMSDTPPG